MDDFGFDDSWSAADDVLDIGNDFPDDVADYTPQVFYAVDGVEAKEAKGDDDDEEDGKGEEEAKVVDRPRQQVLHRNNYIGSIVRAMTKMVSSNPAERMTGKMWLYMFAVGTFPVDCSPTKKKSVDLCIKRIFQNPTNGSLLPRERRMRLETLRDVIDDLQTRFFGYFTVDELREDENESPQATMERLDKVYTDWSAARHAAGSVRSREEELAIIMRKFKSKRDRTVTFPTSKRVKFSADLTRLVGAVDINPAWSTNRACYHLIKYGSRAREFLGKLGTTIVDAIEHNHQQLTNVFAPPIANTLMFVDDIDLWEFKAMMFGGRRLKPDIFRYPNDKVDGVSMFDKFLADNQVTAESFRATDRAMKDADAQTWAARGEQDEAADDDAVPEVSPPPSRVPRQRPRVAAEAKQVRRAVGEKRPRVVPVVRPDAGGAAPRDGEGLRDWLNGLKAELDQEQTRFNTYITRIKTAIDGAAV